MVLITQHRYPYKYRRNHTKLSSEHKEVIWVKYDEAKDNLKFDSNKTALWELNEKLKRRL